MPDDPLRPADPDDFAQAITHALLWDGRRRSLHGDGLMAQIVAERVIAYIQKSGFVIMKRPPASAPTASGHPVPKGAGESG